VIVRQAINYHTMGGDAEAHPWHYTSMSVEDKNGGPNHLREWREFRQMSQSKLAKAVDTTQHMIAYLESGERGLSAKWLRRLASALDTTPGMILDHNPLELSTDVIDMWSHFDLRQKRQLSDIARALFKDGTNG